MLAEKALKIDLKIFEYLHNSIYYGFMSLLYGSYIVLKKSLLKIIF